MLTDPALPVVDPAKPLGRLLLRLEREGILGDINDLCCRYSALIEEVFSDSRRAHVARARHLVWWWLADEKGWSYRAIGDLFGVEASGARYGVCAAGRELGLAEYEERGRKARRAA